MKTCKRRQNMTISVDTGKECYENLKPFMWKTNGKLGIAGDVLNLTVNNLYKINSKYHI